MQNHIASDARALLENDIEQRVGMSFWPEGVNHRGEMYMIFTKESLKRMIDGGNRNDKLKAVYDSMPDDGVCVMIVK